MYLRDSTASFTGCTIAHSRSGSYAIALRGGSCHPTFTNCIIWNDEVQPAEFNLVYGAQVTVSHSTVQGGWPGTGNISEDPLFVQDGSDDYTLRQISPCIDEGNNEAVLPGETDLDGNPRVVDGNGDGLAEVDMGAHEYMFPVVLEAFSVAEHAASGGYAGGNVEFQIDLVNGLCEPRNQFATGEIWIRIHFNQQVDVDDLGVTIDPDPGVSYSLQYVPGMAADKTGLHFDAKVPTGRYTITFDGDSSFPICFAPGDVNCSGDATGLDLAAVTSPTNWNRDLSQGADPRADVNRDGQVTGLDLAFITSPPVWNQPEPPLDCGCAE
jgi:hypothetical protein